jgi:hypothetical protein
LILPQRIAALLLILNSLDITTKYRGGTTYQGAVYAMITAAMSAAHLIFGLAASLREALTKILLLITTGALLTMYSLGPSALEKA